MAAPSNLGGPPPGWPAVLGLASVEVADAAAAVAVLAAGAIGAGAVVGIAFGFVLPLPADVGLAAGVALLVGVVWATGAASLCRWSLGARTAGPGEEPRVRNLVEGLCAGMGLAMPGLGVVDSQAPNLASLGGGRAGPELVVTTGLAAALTRLELEAVIAHELAHLRAGDVRGATLRGATLGGVRAVIGGGVSARAGARWAAREAGADALALSVTRYPPALLSGLGKLVALPAATRDRRSALSEHLWARGEGDGGAGAPGSAPGSDVNGLAGRLEALRAL
ncbi:MAG: M48 family metalloprotease [Acidimicrobiales bacterium]